MVASKDIFALLDEMKIEYSFVSHERVYSIGEMELIDIGNKECIAKNIALTDDKKSSFFLLSVRNDKRVDLKDLRRQLSSRALSFLPPDKLEEMLCLKKGEVTPFALLNDKERKFTYVLDDYFSSSLIGIHPNDNSLTVFLNSNDLLNIFKEKGISCQVLPVKEIM